MNAPKKDVVSKTLKKPIWRDTTIMRLKSAKTYPTGVVGLHCVRKA